MLSCRVDLNRVVDISIIIPIYNGDRFLSETIDSVLSQTYKNFEIIIVDDGSTDNTYQVLSHYIERFDPRVQYSYQKNQGVATARNKGFALARGQYIAFLDQDDVYLPQKLEKQVAIFVRYPEIGIVHSGWRRVNEYGHYIAEVTPWTRIPELGVHEWLLWMPVLFSAMLFRREWLERAGPLNTSLEQACDVDLVQRLLLMDCSSVWLREVTVCYRQHDRNESLKTKLQAKESWTVRDDFFSQPDLPSEIRQQEAEYRYHTLVWIAWRVYITQNLGEACDYLRQSRLYSPYSITQTPLNWIRGFEMMSLENGYRFKMIELIKSPEWQALLQDTMT